MEKTTLPRIVFYYPEGVTIEGQKGVLDFDEEKIVIRVGKEKVAICGKSLTISEIDGDRIFIRGKIHGIDTIEKT